MDHTYSSSTIELDDAGYNDLQNQILNKTAKADIPKDVAADNKTESSTKKFVFRRGDETVELDDDFEVEITADKRSNKLTLKELKERAAGDIAIKNRMHSLAEEKKRVQSTFKTFSDLSKTDPLAALEYIASQAKNADNEFEYANYLQKLADQAEKLGQMTDEERKSWELEKKLTKAEQDLSHKERQEAVALRKQDILSDYPEIGDQQFSSMVEAVLFDEDLMDGLEDENDVMDRVEQLIQETLTQKDIMSVIKEVNPAHLNNQELIFSLSDQIRQNPDLDEEDIRDILNDIIGVKKVVSSERDKDVRILSQKARQSVPRSHLEMQSATPFEILAQQLRDKKQEINKTPLYMR